MFKGKADGKREITFSQHFYKSIKFNSLRLISECYVKCSYTLSSLFARLYNPKTLVRITPVAPFFRPLSKGVL